MSPEIRPFKPLRFKDKRSESFSPPFDTISRELEERLKSCRHNITHLTLPDSGGPEEARSKLDAWLNEQILVTEDEDSIIVLEQKFNFEGKERTRIGTISLVRINPDDGSIKPHEKTFESSVMGRVSIMSKLQSQLEPIFLTVDSDSLEALLAEAVSGLEPDLTYTDHEGTVHNAYTIKEEAKIDSVQKSLDSRPLLVADGHHRLEATRRLSRENNGEKGDFWNYVMAYITPLKDDGLVIAGIHRLLKKNLKLDQVRPVAEEFFELIETDQAGNSQNIVIYDGKYTELIPREEEISKFFGSESKGRKVHAEILNDIFFRAVLKLEDKDLEYGVSYMHDAQEAKKIVDSGEAGLVAIMPKWKKDDFLSAIANGKFLPQKSTFFFPKVPSGIAINAYLEGQ